MILLTGGTGFLGSHILEGLIQSYPNEIVLLKRKRSGLNKIAHLQRGLYETFDIEDGGVEALYSRYPIHTIINCAICYGRSGEKNSEVIATNLTFPINLIEEGLTHGLRLFVNMDSYFNKENMAYSHLLNYAVSKKSFLVWLQYYSSRLKVANLVLEHMYGPRDGEEKFVAMLLRKIAFRKDAQVDLTHGHQMRDFIYVKDVVSACLCVLEESYKKNFRFRSYGVGTGDVKQIRDVPLIISRLSKSPTVLNFGAIPYRKDEIMSSFADASELNNLGWFPEFDLESGLADILHRDEGNRDE